MYFYCICTPSKKGNIQKYHTYYSPYILQYLQKDSNWQETKDKSKAHFVDHFPGGKIQCRLTTRMYIFDKMVMAKLLQNSGIHPTTYIIQNGQIQVSSKKWSQLVEEDCKSLPSSKWFLKPAMSGGGQGIEVLRRIQDYPRYLSSKYNRQYVIQKGVESLLYQGRKFDIRSYLLVVVTNKSTRIYLSKDSCLRISSFEYDENQLKKGINVTNLCYQKHVPGENKKDPYRNSLSLSNWEYGIDVYPKMLNIIRRLGTRIDKQIVKKKTVALLGCDFLIDTKLNSHLLEINCNIGFSIHIRPPELANYLRRMIQEIIPVGYIPLIENKPPPKDSDAWQMAYYSLDDNK